MSGILKYEVGTLSADFDGAVEQVLDEAAHLVVGLAQMYVHVDTGSLRDSIRVERGGESLHWRQFSVRAGGYIVNPKTGRLVDYAAVVEERYPYLWPALEEVAPQLTDLVATELLKLPGVEDVSIEGNEAVVYVSADTSRVMSPLRELESVATRTARIIRMMCGSEDLDNAMMKMTKMLMLARYLQFALHAVEIAEGPVGWLYAGASVTWAAMAGNAMYDGQRGF